MRRCKILDDHRGSAGVTIKQTSIASTFGAGGLILKDHLEELQQGSTFRNHRTHPPLIGAEEEIMNVVWNTLDGDSSGQVSFLRFAAVLFKEDLPCKVGHHRQLFRPLSYQPVR